MTQHRQALTVEGGASHMGLKAPGILTFIISLVLAVTVIIVHFFGADIALLKNSATHFYAMVLAYLILLFGCIMRGM